MKKVDKIFLEGTIAEFKAFKTPRPDMYVLVVALEDGTNKYYTKDLYNNLTLINLE